LFLARLSLTVGEKGKLMTDSPNSKAASLLLLGKGGSGKSTTAIALASLSADMGWRTLILDADPQRSVSEWNALSTPSFAVHSIEVRAAPDVMDRAKRRYDLVIIDHPPARYGGTQLLAQAADYSLICARPFQFDVSLALEWVQFLKQVDAVPLVALTAAPPMRLDGDAPSVQRARQRLKDAQALLWHGQVTHRLAHPDLIGSGMTIMDLQKSNPARAEYERLWFAIRQRIEASRG
jgi:chromosome partitioning protein